MKAIYGMQAYLVTIHDSPPFEWYMYTYDKLHNQEWSWWTPLIYTSKPSILQ